MANIKIRKRSTSTIHEVDFSNLGFGKIFSDHMFVSDYKNGEWQDFEIVPVDRFSIHPANMTFHYGQAIFEGLKATKSFDGTPLLFRPEQNVARLNESAVRMCMPEFPADVMLEAMKQLVLIEKDWIPSYDGSSLYIRPFMFATDEYLGVAPSTTFKFVILACPSGLYYSKPIKLYAEDFYVRAVVGGFGEAKAAGNYAGSLYPARLAQQKGYDQILWLDAVYHKYVQEVGTMNIFFRFNDKLVTPMKDGAILHGITRASIIDIAKSMDIDVEERLISIDEIIDEHKKGNLIEIFGAGTAAVVTNVASLAYKEETITFNPENWSLSAQFKTIINQLRNGTLKDSYGFITPVVQEELVG